MKSRGQSRLETPTSGVANAAPQFPSHVTLRRQVPNVPRPAVHTPTNDQFFIGDNQGGLRPNIEFIMQHFIQEGRLTEVQALYILDQATLLFSSEPNLLNVKSPVIICGDIHGQYYDLMKLLKLYDGIENDNCYLFLGNYVDQGCFGIECLLYLYVLKLWYPTKLTLLRGNHECEDLTSKFTFKRECFHKYSARVYEACIKSFCALPVTAIVDGRFFCVHGGISPELVTLEDIHRLDRFQEPRSQGLLCDLLWADPAPNYGDDHEISAEGHELQAGTWPQNTTRGCSYFFTYEAACNFIEQNGLIGIVRGHELQIPGYATHRKTPLYELPSVFTIFSAPNCIDSHYNQGAVIKFADGIITIRQFNASPHPYWLPKFMNAFTWSLPFVGRKASEMLPTILAVNSEQELESSSEEEDHMRTITDLKLKGAIAQQRRQHMKDKILAMGGVQRVFRQLREEVENTSLYATTGTDRLGAQRSIDGLDSTYMAVRLDSCRGDNMRVF